MRRATTYNYINQFKPAIRSIFDRARLFAYSVQQISEEFKEVIEDARRKKLPDWAIQYLKWYYDFHFEELNHKEVVYLHETSDGKLVDSWSLLSEEDQEKHDKKELSSHHYYSRERKREISHVRNLFFEYDTLVTTTRVITRPFLVK